MTAHLQTNIFQPHRRRAAILIGMWPFKFEMSFNDLKTKFILLSGVWMI